MFPKAGLLTKSVESSNTDQSELEASPAKSVVQVDQEWEVGTSDGGGPMISLKNRTITHSESLEGSDQPQTLYTTFDEYTADGFGNIVFSQRTEKDSHGHMLARRTTDSPYRTDYRSWWLISLPLSRTVKDTVYSGFHGGSGTRTSAPVVTGYDYDNRGILRTLDTGTATSAKRFVFYS